VVIVLRGKGFYENILNFFLLFAQKVIIIGDGINFVGVVMLMKNQFFFIKKEYGKRLEKLEI
jgi:hypothetical protein